MERDGLDFGVVVCLLRQLLIVIFVIDAQVQPQVIQSLTDRQSLLTPGEDRDRDDVSLLCHRNDVKVNE